MCPIVSGTDDVAYFLWHVSKPYYKHIKIWGDRVCIINGRVAINKLDHISHRPYFMIYAAATGFIRY